MSGFSLPADLRLHSLMLGSRNKLDLGVTVRTLLLTTIPDSTSQK